MGYTTFSDTPTYPQNIPREPICAAKKQMTLLKTSGLQQAREAKEAHGQRWHLGWVPKKKIHIHPFLDIYRWIFHYKPSILE